MPVPHLSSGPCWLHVRGPDGPDVLLARYDERTEMFTIIDDACSQYPLVDGWVHKWVLIGAEPVEQPSFIGQGWRQGEPRIVELHVNYGGEWVETETGRVLPSGIPVYADQGLQREILTTR